MLSAMVVYQLLPKTNCKRCDLLTCIAFAVKLLNAKRVIEDCPPLLEPKNAEKQKMLREKLAPLEKALETGLIIHSEKCFGCGNCVVACSVNVANDPKGAAVGLGPKSDKVTLMVENGAVKCLNFRECRRFGPAHILCNACIAACPNTALEFV